MRAMKARDAVGRRFRVKWGGSRWSGATGVCVAIYHRKGWPVTLRFNDDDYVPFMWQDLELVQD